MALCAFPGSTYLLRLVEEVTMATATGQSIAQGAILVSPLRRLAYRAVDRRAFAISLFPSRQARNGSLLALSKLHLLSWLNVANCISM